MSKDKSKSSATTAASDEKHLQSCVNNAVEIVRRQLKPICEDVMQTYKSRYEAEIVVLKAEITELKKSQEFIATQYDEIIEA